MPFLIKLPSDDLAKNFFTYLREIYFQTIHACMYMLARHAGIMCKEIHLWFGGWMICGDANLLFLLLADGCLWCLPFSSWDGSWLLALLLLR
jgi:hypothetical protein